MNFLFPFSLKKCFLWIQSNFQVWPPLVSDHRSPISHHQPKTPKLPQSNNYNYYWNPSHKWPPIWSDHNHFFVWQLWNFSLILSSCKQLPGACIISMFTVYYTTLLSTQRTCRVNMELHIWSIRNCMQRILCQNVDVLGLFWMWTTVVWFP